MKIQDALEENGKAKRKSNPNNYVEIDDYAALVWVGIKSKEIKGSVSLESILKDNWQPYREAKEIRPEKAGELWKNPQGKLLITLDSDHTEDLCFTYVEDAYTPAPLNDMMWGKNVIHNKNGWTRVEPPVEDENVERIKVRYVGYRNQPDICFNAFAISSSDFESTYQDCLDKDMILEISKEG